MTDDLPTPVPSVTPETREFWEATADETLLLRHCSECGYTYYYPKAACPDCFNQETTWIEADGTGTIYSFTVVRQNRRAFSTATPYVLAYVELDEGPRLMTNVVDTDHTDLKIGQAVEVVFENTDGDATLPRFTPI